MMCQSKAPTKSAPTPWSTARHQSTLNAPIAMPGALSAGETRPALRRMMAITSCSERLLVGLARRELVDVCV
eukprot:8993886-Pyramimonas_sp.AAC.1